MLFWKKRSAGHPRNSNHELVGVQEVSIYSKDNTQSELPLIEWYLAMKISNAKSLTELRQRFNSVDSVYGYTVFNIGGNNYRLITAIHYNTQHCYIRTIWTHVEYSKPYNQAKLKRGEL